MKRSTLIAALVGFSTALLLAVGFHHLTHHPLSSQTISSAPGSSTAQNQSAPASRVSETRYGTNLSRVSDWSTQIPFIDGFKSSRTWVAQCDDSEPDCRGEWSTGEEDQLDLDQYGWVRSLPAVDDAPEYSRVGTLILGVDDYLGGTYLVLYDGEGKLEYSLDARQRTEESQPGRDVLEVTPQGNGIHLQIVETNPDNYIRNIRVVPAEYEEAIEQEPFNPVFLEKTKPFAVLRFMDWMDTNDSEQGEWANRPKPDDATYANYGVPVEVMVDLANRLERSPWFNMPHQATDDYVSNFAQYVQQHLNPDLPVYVELSNEVWNGQFDQEEYAIEQGRQQISGREDDTAKGYLWYGKRTAEVLQIWDQVFEGDRDRVVGILGAQSANPWTAETSLEYLRSNGISNAQAGIDAVAIAPYIGLSLSDDSVEQDLERWIEAGQAVALDRLFEELTVGGALADGHPGGALQRTFDWVTDYVDLVASEGLGLVAYEGGQHLAPLHNGMENNEAIADFFIAANRDPRMGEVYRLYLSRWRDEVGDLFVHFSDVSNPGKWGSWGALESIYQDGSPKYDALLEAITATRPVS